MAEVYARVRNLGSMGDYVSARPLLEYAWIHVGRLVNAKFTTESAAALAVLRRSTGEQDGVDELLAAIREDVRRQRDAGVNEYCRPIRCVLYDEGLATYLSGEYEQASMSHTQIVQYRNE